MKWQDITLRLLTDTISRLPHQAEEAAKQHAAEHGDKK
jgi:hypothetical protein